MKKIIIFIVAILVVMEGIGWWAYKSLKKEDSANVNAPTQVVADPIQKPTPDKTTPQDNINATQKDIASDIESFSSYTIGGGDAASFPPPSIETVNGFVQRTIHMGVRQWEWNPAEIKVNYGEKVILIMHNADVPHSIMIPELKVNAVIPEDGAVVTFTANKRGTFDFFCAVPCGSGHGKMQGKIIVE